MDRVVRIKVTDHKSGTYVDETFEGYDDVPSEDVKLKIEDTESGSKVMIWYTT